MNQDQLSANSDVGMSLMVGEEAWVIVDILRQHLGDRLRVKDHGAYLKVETDVGAMEVDMEEVSEVLGRRFTVHDFQVIFSTYYGRPEVFENKIGVYASMTAGVTEPDGAHDDGP